jgi:GT2 family glycosyltransferase
VKKAVLSILNQTYKDFELIIINDHSTDKSLEIVKEFRDKRIKCYSNSKNLGISESRNKGIKMSNGEYIFFTDSDCVADKNWLANGIKTFRNNECLGVEGKTYYVKKNYKKSLSDKTPGDVDSKETYMTCNIAFKRETFIKVGYYDQRYTYHEDREFALRILKYGKILRNNSMVVIHQKKLWDVKSYIKSARRASNRVLLFKKYKDTEGINSRILFPNNLLKALFPPLIIITLIKNKPKTWLEYKLIFASYIFCVYQRILIWKMAWKEGVFLL